MATVSVWWHHNLFYIQIQDYKSLTLIRLLFYLATGCSVGMMPTVLARVATSAVTSLSTARTLLLQAK